MPISTTYQSVTGTTLANLVNAINTQAASGWKIVEVFKDGTTYVAIMVRTSEA